MGTRSLVAFVDEKGKEICVVYRQYDGYPEGRGKELVDFLDGRVLVNGFSQIEIKQSNGMADLVAQWIAYEKTNNSNGEHLVGNVYVYPAGVRDYGEEYIYIVSPNGNGFKLLGIDVYAEDLFGIDEINAEYEAEQQRHQDYLKTLDK